jgi:hypothetical protein
VFRDYLHILRLGELLICGIRLVLPNRGVRFSVKATTDEPFDRVPIFLPDTPVIRGRRLIREPALFFETLVTLNRSIQDAR